MSDDQTRGWMQQAHVGFEFIVAVGLFAAAGYGLDRWLGTAPWLMVVGVFFGFGIGLSILLRAAKRIFND